MSEETLGIYEVLQNAAPQLKNVGSFNPKKLDPEWKPWLMKAERVFIDTFGGDFKKFFGTIATVHQNAIADGDNPEQSIEDWINAEIAELDKHKQPKVKKPH